MGDGVSNATSSTQKSYYAGIQCGEYNGANDDTRANAKAVFGVNLEKQTNYLHGQVGLGSVLSADMEIGKKINLGKGVKLDVAAQGGVIRNNVTNNSIAIVSDGGNIACAYKDYNDGVSKFGVKTMLGTTSRNLNVKVGVETGYRKTYGNSLIDMNSNPDEFKCSVNTNSKSGLYVTPKFQTEFHAGKHLSFNADGSFYEGNIGVRYNF